MFANLKNKLIEEVKASPSKFQQFAAAVSSSASTTPSGSESTTTTTTNENFFSITEEDTPQNSPYKPLKLPSGAAGGRLHHSGPGAIPRTRKLSNSSMTSDASFRLPAYESPPMYHLQSDLESNCSELDDAASTAKLDVVTKEQLFDAYKKSLDRYHKYRSRYTDLAKKYKDLERDSSKARSVLVETQEKAIRRINELREQCSLEQQAKAHLEEALRVEMDDMQCKMQAYQTKLQLLGENPDNVSANLSLTDNASGSASLIDLDDNINSKNILTNQHDLIEKTTLNNNESTILVNGANQQLTQQLQAELNERQRKIEELTVNMLNAEGTIMNLRKQEEENALLLAQTKQAIHSELENKESEVRKLTEKLSIMQKDLQEATKKENQLNKQGDELKELREKFMHLQIGKQESDAKLIATEHMLAQLKEQQTTKANTIKVAEDALKKTLEGSEQRYEELRQQNAQLNEMVQRYQQNEVSLAEIDNELNRTKNENDNLKSTLAENVQKLKEFEAEVSSQKEQFERMQKEKIVEAERLKDILAREQELTRTLEAAQADSNEKLQRIKQLESELVASNEQNEQNESEMIAKLKAELSNVNYEMAEKLNNLKEQLANKEKELKSNSNKLAKQKKQFDIQHNRIREQSDEIDMLRTELNKHEQHLSNLQSESRIREEQTEVEKAKLKTQVQTILQDIERMQEEMNAVKTSHSELEAEKLKLEHLIENMQQESQNEQLTDTETKLHQVETKLQNIETENSQLAERNCLLEEQNNRLEKQLMERERQREAEEANANELRLKLDATEIAMQKLNEKMSQVLDENSRMHNVQELMDHDYRTLQDKYDALEKKKLKTEDEQTCLQEELDQLQERKLVLEARLRETVEQLQQAEEKCAEEKKKAEAYEEELKAMANARERLESENQALSTELKQYRATKSDDEKLEQLMRDQKRRIEEMELELVEKDEAAKASIDNANRENIQLKKKLNELESSFVECENTKEETVLLREQVTELNHELSSLNSELKQSHTICQELENQIIQLKELVREKESRENELEVLKAEVNILKEAAETQREEVASKTLELVVLKQKLESANAMIAKLQATEIEMQNLQERENNLRTEASEAAETAAAKILQLETHLHNANNDIERLHESNDAVQVEMDALKNKNETQIQSLEASLKQLREDNERFQQELANWKVSAEKLANLEQMQIENEYLNKHVNQLEKDLEAQRAETSTQLNDAQEQREKFKSLQCELYVLRENAEKFNTQLEGKQNEIESAKDECKGLREMLTKERAEMERQLVHTKYITEQNDAIQSDLLQKNNQLTETEQQLNEIKLEYDEMKSTYATENESKIKELEELRADLQKVMKESEIKVQLQQELGALRVELAERNSSTPHEVPLTPTTVTATEMGQKSIAAASEPEHLRRINETLQRELEDLKYKSTAEITELQQEIEDLQSNAKHMAERLLEVERLRAALQVQQTLPNTTANAEEASTTTVGVGATTATEGLSEPKVKVEELLQREKAELAAKLYEIMNEVRDVSERNLFLEQQCENYLILEQSNERLKLQNAKLSRQLDETLVSMHHSEGITANTEFEYLRNIMFQYLTGSANGNNETLVKVISAVLKFSPQQTQVAIEKEHQRRSLLNKIL